MKIIFACDRTGGHIFPALTLAKELVKKNIYAKEELSFLAPSTLLKKYIQDEGFKIYGRSLKIRNIFLEGTLRIYEAIYLIFFLKPKIIIGFGGRDSFFLILFGALFRIKTAIYEPNIKIGRANKLLALVVNKIFYGFPKRNFKQLESFVGIPLRDSIKRIEKKKAQEALGFSDQPVILCFGGSQGASFVNRVFIDLLKKLPHDLQLQVIHITGKNDYAAMKNFYSSSSRRVFLKDFYPNMEVLYSLADIVISRAGAFTLAEIAYYNIPAIFIPHPQGWGHQRENAYFFKAQGAGYTFLQDSFSAQDFLKVVKDLLLDINKRESIKKNFKNIQLGVSSQDFCDKICEKLGVN